MGMVTRGENCHARWEWPCKVRMATRGGNGQRGENCHTRWEWSREMRIGTRSGNGHVRYEPPSEILHSLIFSFLTNKFRKPKKNFHGYEHIWIRSCDSPSYAEVALYQLMELVPEQLLA